MYPEFLSYLCDPEDGSELALVPHRQENGRVVEGVLKSPSNEYPVVNGIPRFVNYAKENYSRSFAYQWHRWPRLQFESENVDKPMEGYTRSMWHRITGVEPNANLSGKTLLDLGCGPGRFIDTARALGAAVIGLDYSNTVEVAAENFRDDERVLICQADALNPPVRNNSLDGVFSVGVLHHTPSPEKGVEAAHRMVKPGGWFALSVYGRGGYYDFITVRMWRAFFKALWPVFQHHPPLIYTYVAVTLFRKLALLLPGPAKILRAIFPFIALPDYDWSLLDTFDSITPSYQSGHVGEEVNHWMKKAGFDRISQTNWGETSYRGIKE